MTYTERSLLDGVLANPFDDGPRLMMADWYDENGQPERSEFIRVQIELARYDKAIACCKTPEDCYYANKCGGNCGVDERDMICCPLRKRNDELSANCFDWFEMPAGMAPGTISWERGFVHSVSLSLAAFMGEPCERCGGRAVVPRPNRKRRDAPAMDCPDCKGSGRTPGLVDTIAAKWPVTSVTLSDKRPHFDNESGMYEFGRGNEFSSELPEELLAVMRKITGQTSGHLFFETECEAITVLSHACVDLMRERAGMPAMR